MKINYVIASLFLSTIVLTSCGDAKTETKEKTESNEKEVIPEVKEEVISDSEDLKEQWKEIVSEIKQGKSGLISMYLKDDAPNFSKEEWDFLDLSQPEYYETFNSYNSFNELPDASNMTEPTKVVTVNFETESDGMVFESAAMIYLQVVDGLIWIVGCELAG